MQPDTTSKKNSKQSLIIFIITIIVGLFSLVISYTFHGQLPEIFVGETYPGGDCGPGCSWDGNQCRCDPGWGKCIPAGGCNGCKDDAAANRCNCESGGNDPADCCGGDSSPTPPPTTSFSCTGLTPQPSPVNAGDQLTFTCQGTSQNITLISLKFRVLDKNGTAVNNQTKDLSSGQKSAQFVFTVPNTPSVAPFRAQCQVCKAGSVCTAWGQAN